MHIYAPKTNKTAGENLPFFLPCAMRRNAAQDVVFCKKAERPSGPSANAHTVCVYVETKKERQMPFFFVCIQVSFARAFSA